MAPITNSLTDASMLFFERRIEKIMGIVASSSPRKIVIREEEAATRYMPMSMKELRRVRDS